MFINENHHKKIVRCGVIWGTLEWYDVVYTTTEPYEYDVAHILAVTL